MAKVEKMQELHFEAEDKVGMLADITSKIADCGVNIVSLCAYGIDQKAYFMVITSDNAKVKEALSDLKIKEQEVVVVGLEDKVGSSAAMAQKLKNAGINLTYIYATTCGCEGVSCNCRLVFASSDNDKAVEVLSS